MLNEVVIDVKGKENNVKGKEQSNNPQYGSSEVQVSLDMKDYKECKSDLTELNEKCS
jgi:hypothetical protein